MQSSERPASFCILRSAFCIRISSVLWTGEIVPFQYPVEDAVDELAGLLRAELFRDLDGLVDDHELGRVRLVEKLVDGHADDVAIDGGHARQAPVLGLSLDHVVD